MSAPSPKELIKAVSSFAQSPVLPLPDELIQVIDGFLDKHADKFEDGLSDKLHEEFMSIFKKDIGQEPSRVAAFVAILRRLRPLIGQPAKVLQWFDLFLPLLGQLDQNKDLSSEIPGFWLDIITADDGNDTSSSPASAAAPVAEKLMMIWLIECQLFHGEVDMLHGLQGKSIEHTLLTYGKRRPKDFMILLDRFFCRKAHRSKSIFLLSSFIQSQPPHLYLILQTPLFSNLLNCLQRDTSTTTVSLALTALTMILPHVPSSLVPHLPTLFNIYARLLFWDSDQFNTAINVNKEHRLSPNALAWEQCSFSPVADGTTIPQLLNYFTILYGLYPMNFMDYIRKPQRYLRHAEASDLEEIEVQPTEIRHASERFRHCHLLHENFYTLTIDSEKTDFGRWIKSEPSEVVADCMALRQIPDESLVPDGLFDLSHMMNVDRDELDKYGKESALLSSSFIVGGSNLSRSPDDTQRSARSTLSDLMTAGRSQHTIRRQPSHSSYFSNRDSSSTRRSVHDGDSPTISRQITTSGSQTQLQDLINSNKVAKSGLHQSLTNESAPSLSLSHHEPIPEKQLSQPYLNPAVVSATQLPADSSNDQYRELLRYVFIVYNDLLFERFLKQQHLTHIGELRRRHGREAASEAETQNLINVNKQLKQRLEEAKKAELQAKTEGEKSRTLSKKWEAEISQKLKALREEQKKWNAQGSILRNDLDSAKAETEKLRALVCEVEVRELQLKQKIQSANINFSEAERLRSEIERLSKSERDLQAKEPHHEAAAAEVVDANRRAEMLSMKLAAHESDLKRTCDQYESQITELKTQLQDVLGRDGEQSSSAMKIQLKKALEANQAVQAEMKLRVGELTLKNAVLQAKIFEQRSEFPHRSKSMVDLPTDSEEDSSTGSDEPSDARNRRQRGLSDPQTFESDVPDTSSAIGSSSLGRTSVPLGVEAAVRTYGRGGVQDNRKKKDKKEEKDKKKTGGGLRGIRGFA
ncbi:hypothetical protein F5Y16DRAFT_372891 [Xylariaceae sp. FL0255]|nr:hypothetical protein F5Y16DRAFT_372891 [Xylariaceae sp. FL0255]